MTELIDFLDLILAVPFMLAIVYQLCNALRGNQLVADITGHHTSPSDINPMTFDSIADTVTEPPSPNNARQSELAT